MVRWANFTLILMLVGAGPMLAADEKPKEAKKTIAGVKKPIGTWQKLAGDFTITFEIKADNVRITLKGSDDRQIQVLADYGMSKDGCLFGRICQVKKGDAEGGPAEGDLFSFRVKQEKDKIVISDLKVSTGGDDAKNLIEGDYEKK
jgi:hypothetical protein